MRAIGALFFGDSMLLAAPAARAQTYDAACPVCLQRYGIGWQLHLAPLCRWRNAGWWRTGRAAQCITNPCYGKARRRY